MRKNVNSEYLIEVEAAGERLTLYPQAVLSFGPIKETEDKFYFEFKVSFDRFGLLRFLESQRRSRKGYLPRRRQKEGLEMS